MTRPVRPVSIPFQHQLTLLSRERFITSNVSKRKLRRLMSQSSSDSMRKSRRSDGPVRIQRNHYPTTPIRRETMTRRTLVKSAGWKRNDFEENWKTSQNYLDFHLSCGYNKRTKQRTQWCGDRQWLLHWFDLSGQPGFPLSQLPIMFSIIRRNRTTEFNKFFRRHIVLRLIDLSSA